MNEVSPAFALLLGAVIGLLLFGPVQRWVATLVHTLRERRARDGEHRKGSGALLLIFATLHPAPWLLLLGLPYAVYRLWSDPLRWMWACLLAGALCAPLLLLAALALRRSRLRASQE
jgi:hypothetical protein